VTSIGRIRDSYSLICLENECLYGLISLWIEVATAKLELIRKDKRQVVDRLVEVSG
jgi:hypothetical protein